MISALDEVADSFGDFGVTISDEAALRKLHELCARFSIKPDDVVNEWIAVSTSLKLDRHLLTLHAVTQLEDALTRRQRTPARSAARAADPKLKPPAGTSSNAKRSLGNQFTDSAVSASPVTPASASRYAAAREKSGTVVATFGFDSSQRVAPKTAPLEWSVFYPECGEQLAAAQYMQQKFHAKAVCVAQHVETVGDAALAASMDALPPQSAEELQTLVGMIGADFETGGRLNPQSVVLFVPRAPARHAATVALDLTNLAQYSLFPGKVAAFHGHFGADCQLFVVKAVQDSPPLRLEYPLRTSGGWQLVVACGPFSPSDDVSNFQPLRDLLAAMSSNAPQFCLLCGPFIDEQQAALACDAAQSDNFQLTFERFLRELVLFHSQHGTRFFVQCSHRDAFHHPVYPTFAAEMPAWASSGVTSLPDPCVLRLDEQCLIALTSVDVLMQLSGQELTVGATGDRLTRLVSHLLAQRTFAPLLPPPETLPLDYERWAAAGQLTALPHLLLLPSDLKYFVKDVAATVCLNPGRLMRGVVGGTFGRVFFSPPSPFGAALPPEQALSVDVVCL